MEKILQKANELGHLLKQHEIVRRFNELSDRLDRDPESKKLLDEFAQFSMEYQQLEQSGAPIEVETKQQLSQYEEKIKTNDLIAEFLATQSYYMALLTQVNEAISNPTGEPPTDSGIIMPDSGSSKIIMP